MIDPISSSQLKGRHYKYPVLLALFEKLPMALLLIVVAALFCLALIPERPARILTAPDGWEVLGPASSKVALSGFPVQFRQVRQSAIESPGGFVFRTWTPDHGIAPLEVTSAPFYPTPYMSVVITGTNRTSQARIHAIIECDANGQSLEIFKGSVGNHAAEALLSPPSGWCPDTARLKFTSAEPSVNVGVGAVFEISGRAYLKSSFLGRLPYLIAALVIFATMMFAGAALARCFDWRHDPAPIALVSLGVASLAALYLASAVSHHWRWAGAAVMAVFALLAIVFSGRQARRQTALALAPYGYVWSITAFVYLTIAGLTLNGLGHWEPNYRFWPAVGAADGELPWLFAEAVRRGWSLANLYGGNPVPTDLPPLMAGAQLLLADVFGWLQSGNDGPYLQGQAYNAAALTLNALWAPACWWLLVNLRRNLHWRECATLLIFVGCLPIVLLDTTHGGQKIFGAAYALTALGLAWQFLNQRSAPVQRNIVLTFVLGAFSLLADIGSIFFLAPLALIILFQLRNNPRSIIAGSITAVALLASWSIYKAMVLPSANPMIKYLLTGDYGFNHPERSIWEALRIHYDLIAPWQWLQAKKIMLLQSVLPVNHSFAQISMNTDYGASALDRLRAWDQVVLSRGNLVIPFIVIAALCGALRAFVFGRPGTMQADTPFVTMIGLSLLAWIIMIIGTEVPATVQQWPQTALLGLALSGAVIVYGRYPRLFAAAMFATLSYTAMVWVFSSLLPARSIDLGAAGALVLLGAWLSMHRLLPSVHTSQAAPVATWQSNNLWAAITTNQTIRRVGNASLWTTSTRILAVLAFLFASVITVRYIDQPLVDGNGFRQTQTALSAYWMLKEGWQLAYQTPVVGFPWSIPFEFPLYQALVVAISSSLDLNFEAVGRFISFVFLIACGWPAFAITRRLDLSTSIAWAFCALFWTAPLNVFWGRTFMIETMALFFAFACIPYAIDVIRLRSGWRSAILFLLFATLGVLQKSTTCGPVLLFLLVACTITHARQRGINLSALRRALYPIAILCAPLAIGLAWAHYADVVKTANPFGKQLTSKALTLWNFGSLDQKLSFETWRVILWERSLMQNAAGYLGATLLLLPWLGNPKHRHFAWLALAATTLFLLPLLIFTNLHFVHNYYQVGCVLFLIAALAIVIGGWLPATSGISALTPFATLIFMLVNLVQFFSGYGIVAARPLPEQDPISVQAYTVGRYLRDHTPSNTGLAIFGQGWSSEIAFQAQRKSITVPNFSNERHQVWQTPEAYIGDLKLGAIVVCPEKESFPSEVDVTQRLSEEPNWHLERVSNCQILLPRNQ